MLDRVPINIEKSSIEYKDLILLQFLQRNFRYNLAKIAKDLNTDENILKDRLSILEEKKIILDYQFRLNPKALGYNFTAFLSISHNCNLNRDFSLTFNSIPEILESYYLSGEYSIWIKVIYQDNQHLQNIVNEIYAIDGVVKVNVSICLDQQINRQISLG